MKLFLGLLAITLLPAATSCGPSIDTYVDYDPEYDFSGVWSYAWLEDLEVGAAASPRPDIVDDRVRVVVDRHLATRQLPIYVDDPSFLIGYTALVEQEVAWTTVNARYAAWPGAYGYGGGWGYGTARVPTLVSQGTLVLDILDPRTGQLIWRGVAEADISRDTTAERRQERLNEAVQLLLEGFPP